MPVLMRFSQTFRFYNVVTYGLKTNKYEKTLTGSWNNDLGLLGKRFE